jgi:signal transduction histidine kinase
MGALARVQERELRAWLYGKNKTIDGVTLDGAIDALAGRIEQAHQVKVESVVVGDAALDERLGALLDACREALVNAANHSGSKELSLYVEVEPDAVTAYVRDQGSGFDPSSVQEDRRGIADSIVGRMRRYKGDAVITSDPGKGTEVRLRIPTR